MRGLREAMNVDSIRKRYEGKEGVELLSITRSDDLEKKTIVIETKAKFASLGAYFRVGAGMLARGADLELVEKDGVWTFTRRVHVEMMGFVVNDQMSEDVASQLEMLKMTAAELMGGMEISLDMDVPGTVVETNGTKNAAGTGVSWSLVFDDMNNPKKMKHWVSFKGEGLALAPFHVRVGLEGRSQDVAAAAAAPAPPTTPATPDAPRPPEAPKSPEPPKEPAGPAVPR
jgi:hypothetical protein